MQNEKANAYGFNVIANGRNWNALKLLTGLQNGRSDHRLVEVRFTLKEDEILITIKKDSPKGPQIAFLAAETLDDALYVLAAGVKQKTLRWKTDNWRSTRNDKSES